MSRRRSERHKFLLCTETQWNRKRLGKTTFVKYIINKNTYPHYPPLHDDSRAKIHSRVKSFSDPAGAVKVKRHLLYREIYKNHVINE